MAARLAAVRRRIEAAGGRPRASVRVVAVTKGFGPGAVAAAVGAGLHDVGENYAQELVAKAAAVAPPVARGRGALALPGRRPAEQGAVAGAARGLLAVGVAGGGGAEIARRRPGAAVLVEVDASGVPGRTGCAAREVPALVAGAGRDWAWTCAA